MLHTAMVIKYIYINNR